MTETPTEDEMRAAYARAGLAALGLSFEQATADPIISRSLRCMCASDRRWAASTLRYGSVHLEKLNQEAP